MALCPWCGKEVQTHASKTAIRDRSFAAHVARCPDVPPETKAAWRGGWPDYLQGGGSTARRKP